MDSSRISDITVGLTHPGGRVDRVAKPLLNSDMDVEIEPDNPYEKDIIMLDNAGPKMIFPIYKSDENTKVIYRIRGDMLRAYIEMNHTPIKYYLAKYLISKVDGAVTIESRVAKTFEKATGVSPIEKASLYKNADEWPTIEHTSRNVHAITLTNTNYLGKVQPLIDFAPYISEFLENNGGKWHIYGRGKKSKYLKSCVRDYDNIKFKGYSKDVKETMGEYNTMLHFSVFDSLPNAILEGMACGMPVITNPFDVFVNYGEPIIVSCSHEIQSILKLAQSPMWRGSYGAKGIDNIKEDHSLDVVSKQYERAFLEFIE